MIIGRTGAPAAKAATPLLTNVPTARQKLWLHNNHQRRKGNQTLSNIWWNQVLEFTMKIGPADLPSAMSPGLNIPKNASRQITEKQKNPWILIAFLLGLKITFYVENHYVPHFSRCSLSLLQLFIWTWAHASTFQKQPHDPFENYLFMCVFIPWSSWRDVLG